MVRQEKQVKTAKRDRSVQIIVCSSEWNQCMLNSVNKFQNVVLVTTGRARLIRSHSSARFYFELSGNSN